MNKASIYLAGWLTTAVVAAVIITGLTTHVFGSKPPTDPAATAVTQQVTDPPGSDQPSTTYQSPSGSDPVTAGEETIYVYPDGSPVPASEAKRVAKAERNKWHDDDEDRDDEEDEEHEDEHEDEDEDEYGDVDIHDQEDED